MRGGLEEQVLNVGRLTGTLWRISAYQGVYAFKRVLTCLYVKRNRKPSMRSKYPPLVPVEGIGGGGGSCSLQNRSWRATALDNVRRLVFAVRRGMPFTTSRFLVLMLLDLCFAGLPSFPPLKKIYIPRGAYPTPKLSLL